MLPAAAILLQPAAGRAFKALAGGGAPDVGDLAEVASGLASALAEEQQQTRAALERIERKLDALAAAAYTTPMKAGTSQLSLACRQWASQAHRTELLREARASFFRAAGATDDPSDQAAANWHLGMTFLLQGELQGATDVWASASDQALFGLHDRRNAFGIPTDEDRAAAKGEASTVTRWFREQALRWQAVGVAQARQTPDLRHALSVAETIARGRQAIGSSAALATLIDDISHRQHHEAKTGVSSDDRHILGDVDRRAWARRERDFERWSQPITGFSAAYDEERNPLLGLAGMWADDSPVTVFGWTIQVNDIAAPFAPEGDDFALPSGVWETMPTDARWWLAQVHVRLDPPPGGGTVRLVLDPAIYRDAGDGSVRLAGMLGRTAGLSAYNGIVDDNPTWIRALRGLTLPRPRAFASTHPVSLAVVTDPVEGWVGIPGYALSPAFVGVEIWPRELDRHDVADVVGDRWSRPDDDGALIVWEIPDEQRRGG